MCTNLNKNIIRLAQDKKKKKKKHDTKVNHIVTNQDFLPKIFVLISD